MYWEVLLDTSLGRSWSASTMRRTEKGCLCWRTTFDAILKILFKKVCTHVFVIGCVFLISECIVCCILFGVGN